MAAQGQCPLLGGDTVATPGPLTLSITAIGAVPVGQMIRRTTARPSDALYLTGTIGDAALGLALRAAELGLKDAPVWAKNLDSARKTELIGRYLSPRPRLALVPALRACASAAMDVSDGLIGDLRALLRESGAVARVDLRRIPLSPPASAALNDDPALFDLICCGGDDYEILCAIPQDAAARFETLAHDAGVEVTRIGEALAAEAAETFIGPDGSPREFGQDRFSHFRP
jgi:thiamine-monophosphate kinase